MVCINNFLSTTGKSQTKTINDNSLRQLWPPLESHETYIIAYDFCFTVKELKIHSLVMFDCVFQYSRETPGMLNH